MPDKPATAEGADQASDGSAAPTPEATAAPPSPPRSLDETIPGGAYRIGDRWVDADGKEIDPPGGATT